MWFKGKNSSLCVNSYAHLKKVLTNKTQNIMMKNQIKFLRRYLYCNCSFRLLQYKL